MFSMLFGGGSNPGDAARLRRIERKLDLIIEHLGIDTGEDDDPVVDEIRQLAEGGEKIAAIKLYRERFGSGLAEAKQAVEDLMR